MQSQFCQSYKARKMVRCSCTSMVFLNAPGCTPGCTLDNFVKLSVTGHISCRKPGLDNKSDTFQYQQHEMCSEFKAIHKGKPHFKSLCNSA